MLQVVLAALARVHSSSATSPLRSATFGLAEEGVYDKIKQVLEGMGFHMSRNDGGTGSSTTEHSLDKDRCDVRVSGHKEEAYMTNRAARRYGML